ncbi:hypothetical protein Hanom_Chr08g00714331 [Helianthus anomalus]
MTLSIHRSILCQPEIRKFCIVILINQDIRRLKITIYHFRFWAVKESKPFCSTKSNLYS